MKEPFILRISNNYCIAFGVEDEFEFIDTPLLSLSKYWKLLTYTAKKRKWFIYKIELN